MKLRVLFYKAKFDGHLLDDAISLWTGIFNWGTGPYSHAEIWIPECGDRFQAPRALMGGAEDVYWGTCYTSTMRDDVNGVVRRPAAEVLKHPDRWDYIEIEVSEHEYSIIVEWMDWWVKKNPGYDIWCILSFFWFQRQYGGDKYICSEFCQQALRWINIFSEVACPSPRRLSRWLVDKGYKIESLGE